MTYQRYHPRCQCEHGSGSVCTTPHPAPLRLRYRSGKLVQADSPLLMSTGTGPGLHQHRWQCPWCHSVVPENFLCG